MNWLWIIVGLIFISGLWLYYHGQDTGNPETDSIEQHYRRQGWLLIGIAAIATVVLVMYPSQFTTENVKAQMPKAVDHKGWKVQGKYLMPPGEGGWSWNSEWEPVEHNGEQYYAPIQMLLDEEDY